MKKLGLVISILLSLALRSQQIVPLDEKSYIDSLQNVVRLKTDNQSKAAAYFLLSNYYRNTDSTLSKKHLETARSLGKSNPFISAQYFYYQGQYYADRDKEKAAASYLKGTELLSKFKNKESEFLQSRSWFGYGIAQKNKEGYPFLIKIMLEKSIPLIAKYENSRNLGFEYTQLALMFTYNAEFKKAENYNNKALEILEKNAPASSELFFTYLNIASNFFYQAKGDMGKSFLDKAEKLIQPYPDSSSNSYYFYNKTLYYITKQKNEETLSAIEKGLYYTKKFQQNLLTQMFYVHKYDILKKQKKYTEARDLLKSILKEKTLVIDANNRKTIYLQLSSINEVMGNTKEALAWDRYHSKLSDSLNAANIKLEINKLEAKYNTAEKERKIASLNAEKKQKELEVSRKNYYLLGLSLVSFFFISLAISLSTLYRKNKKLSEQKEINLQQKITDIKQKEELTLTKAILEGEERERERIAKDLHDGLGGMLAGVKINFSTWSSNNLVSEEHEDFYKILEQLDRSVSELRHIARNLMPESLLNFGLETALRDLCDFYTRKNLTIDFQPINIHKELSLSTQLHIYRIIQELLANAVKHSGANSILLQCSQAENTFFITIEDNGRGFVKDTIKPTSMGFQNIRNRVNYLLGKMEINSDNEGTNINIELNTYEI
ncbi:ATP-binding protein [Chryseobacterium paridis]|uniref:histidine kinase n=1 Tax=Chryseobacterium paridis TaxID=2800328 RepID=A0ABS1FT05_9FLAO|nr:ATP-binding protein [Chryseobacterium paridis]MBK1895554.1 hypothetical protein [Chryseobacterium paridis]